MYIYIYIYYIHIHIYLSIYRLTNDLCSGKLKALGQEDLWWF